ncbi:MAG: putative metal-binding motif-containing protein [Deltaproteobacteria bacterium]|nr:putative metal-binding motif-containing protein [Deltaproteobacteria bacterium]
MNPVRTRGLLAALVGAVSLLAACSEPTALLLTVSAERKVASFDFTVRDMTAMQNVAETLGQALPADQDISQPGKELKLAVRFLDAGTYLVHIVGRDAAGAQVGSRAYRVEGTVEASLKLAAVPGGGDQDGDGFPSVAACAAMAAEGVDCVYADCDDNDPRVNPLATERCNGRDDDCDGKLGPDETDVDGDGYLKCLDCNPNDETDFNFQQYFDCRDCDDERYDVHPASRRDAVAHPAATEDCTNCGDGVDHNCDGKLNPCNDADCDGTPGCGKEDAPLPPLCDCNDNDRNIHPGVTEVCGDHIDNNCDGQTDEGCMPCDVDGDGFMRDDPTNGCNPPAGQADCDDTDSGIYPGAAASCNGKQGGCRDLALRGFCARDSLGQVTIHDCSLRNAANDPKCQGADPACQARTGCPSPTCDGDGDGFMRNDPGAGCNPLAGLEDCDDADPHTFPGAPDRCGDGKKQNCSYDSPCTDDADGDGYNSTEECDDTDPSRHPWAVELCNGKDDDCDGLEDEGNPDSTTGQTVAGTRCTDNDVGECSKKEGACICSRLVPVATRNPASRRPCKDEDVTAAASPRCVGAAQPQQETAQSCNGLDDDCDGIADDATGEVPCAIGTACKWTGSLWKCACDPATGCSGCCVTASPADSCVFIESVSTGQCGIGGEACHTCNDLNVCTTDSCDIGVCHNTNFADHQGCPGGQCRVPAAGAAVCCGTCWTGTACVGSSDASCGTGGVDCFVSNTSCGTCLVCDGGGHCGYVSIGQDTNEQCSTQAASTCGRTGVCDGAGACALYPAGTNCALCKICNGSGSCNNVGAGNDPNNECADQGAASCGTTGSCNGSGSCALYGSGTRCASCKICNGSGSCNNVGSGNDPNDDCTQQAQSTCGLNGNCDGGGGCALWAAGTRCASCKICNGSGACNNVGSGNDPNNDCSDQGATSCGTTGVCNGGGGCTLYASGTDCGTCRSCDGGGNCNVYVGAGQPSGGDCSDQGAASCGTNGLCNGSGACQRYPSGTDCGVCRSCDGSGNCNVYVGAGQPSGGDCSDQGAASCGTNGRCDGSGGCQRYPSGTDCGLCKMCNGSGACNDVGAGSDPNGDCTAEAASTCGTTGDCDGNGACALWPSTTECGTGGDTSCALCNGTGTCVPVANGTSCASGHKCCSGVCCANPGNCSGSACP